MTERDLIVLAVVLITSDAIPCALAGRIALDTNSRTLRRLAWMFFGAAGFSLALFARVLFPEVGLGREIWLVIVLTTGVLKSIAMWLLALHITGHINGKD